MAQQGETHPEGEIVIARRGRAGRITLNRPKALNALTLNMVRHIRRALDGWAGDPDILRVVIDGAGERGLCAGGDVKAFYDLGPQAGREMARTFWREEYALNALIAHYPKPYVSIMDGKVMGGGIGVSAHGSNRVVTERSLLAMPETAIGLSPDIGGTWLLSHLPGEIGTYLALTGRGLNGADAMAVGLAEHFVETGRIGDLIAALESAQEPTSEVIAGFEGDPGTAPIETLRPLIDRTFSQARVEDILAALERQDDPQAAAICQAFAGRSPLCTKTAFASIRAAKDFSSLEAALTLEYRIVVRLFENGEFIEGIRALLIDRDGKPNWRHASLEDVSERDVRNMLAPLPGSEDLVWPLA